MELGYVLHQVGDRRSGRDFGQRASRTAVIMLASVVLFTLLFTLGGCIILRIRVNRRRRRQKPVKPRAPVTLTTFEAPSEIASEACAICLEDLGDSPCALGPCKEHTLHAACLQRWVKRDPSCPVCRQGYPSDESGPAEPEGSGGQQASSLPSSQPSAPPITVDEAPSGQHADAITIPMADEGVSRTANDTGTAAESPDADSSSPTRPPPVAVLAPQVSPVSTG